MAATVAAAIPQQEEEKQVYRGTDPVREDEGSTGCARSPRNNNNTKSQGPESNEKKTRARIQAPKMPPPGSANREGERFHLSLLPSLAKCYDALV